MTKSSIVLKKYLNKKYIHSNTASITFLGPKGSYSHLAAIKYAKRYFNKIIENSFLKFYDVIKYVENFKADYAVLPIKNTNSGLINEVYDLLQLTNLSIIGEIILPIDHCILVNDIMTDIDQIKIIYSHPQPFKQCSRFIKRFSHWKIKYTTSTSSAIKKVSLINSPSIAALGSELGGDLYKLRVLKRNLSNKQYNCTRFIVLSRKFITFPNYVPTKTTLIMSTNQEQVNHLVNSLLIILRNSNLSITKLNSETLNKNSYKEKFYVDVQGNIRSVKIQQAIQELKSITYFIKVLGCYPIDNFSSLIEK